MKKITLGMVALITLFATTLGFAQSPGGVAGATLWLKANVGATTTQWDNQVTNAAIPNLVNSGATIAIEANSVGFNFNSSIDFNGSHYRRENLNRDAIIGASQGTLFVVTNKSNPDLGITIWRENGGDNNWQTNGFRSAQSEVGGVNGLAYASANVANQANINGMHFTSGSVYENNINGFINTAATAPTILNPDFNNYLVTPGHWPGFSTDDNISEVVVYSSDVGTNGFSQIQSYLAIKYGITLNDGATTYVDSNNSPVWNSDLTYKSDVFGIANDSGSALDQQISKSVNTTAILTVSTDTNFTLANGSHTSLVDGQSLMVGNNAGVTTIQENEVDATLYPARITREWKVQNTGTVGAVNLKFNGFNNTWVLLTKVGSGDFSTGTTSAGYLNAAGEIAVTLPNDTYFTLAQIDTDSDGILDVFDSDIDGDGTVDNGPDADGDGVNTDGDPDDTNTDTDGDGIPDGADTDSNTSTGLDADGDGIVDDADADSPMSQPDADGDGIADDSDPVDNNADDDGDGILNGGDYDPSGTGTPINGTDTDGDGINDLGDADIDGDGTVDNGPDTDGDGINDGNDATPNGPDTDGDGIPDAIDSDVDGDGTVDNGPDADGDGINTVGDPDDTNTDTDGDGIPDGADTDSYTAPDNADADGDGIVDDADADSPMSQPDADGDGIADDSDPVDNNADDDGDGILNGGDYDPSGTGTPINGTDTDGDGINDLGDADPDGIPGNGDDQTPDVDMDGIVDTYDSDVLDINDVVLTSVKISPNPASSNIEVSGLDTIDYISIYNILGKKVLSTTKTNIDISALKGGIYLMRIVSGEESATKRFVKK